MAPPRLTALFEPASAEQSGIIRSPAVGVMEGLPDVGSLLGRGAPIGSLRIFGRRVVVVLPDGACGVVKKRLVTESTACVAWGQPLLEIRATFDLSIMSGESSEQPGATAGPEGEAGLILVRSPTDGVFYHRPSPASPPFIRAGAVVSRGATLGLVEIMKCFSAILYGEGGPADQARVESIDADDGSEVRGGQVLVRLRALTPDLPTSSPLAKNQEGDPQ